jgi:hypothetical protein
MILLSALLMLVPPASARVVEYTHDVWEHEAKAALEAQGFTVHNAYGVGGKHFVDISDDETRDPLPVIAAIKTRAQRVSEEATALQALEDELAALEAKDDAGVNLTAAEQRRFRKLLLRLLRRARQ